MTTAAINFLIAVHNYNNFQVSFGQIYNDSLQRNQNATLPQNCWLQILNLI